jgi:hypothetical protein
VRDRNEEDGMKKIVVVCLALSMSAVVAACANDVEDEETAQSSEDLRRSTPGECQLGNGLYCGGNGVNGAANVLYRCTNGTVSRVAQCYGPCVRMPDGINDKCNGYASNNNTSSGGSGASPPPLPLKKANWASCRYDSECQTNRCGCNGGNLSQCLPNDAYPKTCAGLGGTGGSKANWEPCTYDGQCQTNWCGCNGGTERRCLPSTQYPKYCK